MLIGLIPSDNETAELDLETFLSACALNFQQRVSPKLEEQQEARSESEIFVLVDHGNFPPTFHCSPFLYCCFSVIVLTCNSMGKSEIIHSYSCDYNFFRGSRNKFCSLYPQDLTQ